MVLGLASGVFYREYTKLNDFAQGEYTQLTTLHTHFLVLGFVVFLVVLALEKLFGLSQSKMFTWFFWVYNFGLLLTASMMAYHGMLHVDGSSSVPMTQGMAGLGHMSLGAGMLLLFLSIRKALKRPGALQPLTSAPAAQ